MNTVNTQWNFTQKFLFRFFFIYFMISIAPWTWLENIPYVAEATVPWYWLQDQIVQIANRSIFKVYKELVPLNGSGDTSWAWTHLWFFTLFSLIVAAIWSAVDRNKPSYPRWNYLLVTVVRYNVAMVSFGYGIIKLFALQMWFPSLSQLATPLGEYLPMRFSWMFIGYSAPYQIFSGAAEVLAGLLLFNRKTATLGALVALAVFTNVMAMNLSYDIPVKLFSTHLVLMSLFLVLQEYKRILCFFVFNQTTAAGTLYEITLTKKWQRITRYVLKGLFVICIIIFPFYNSYERYVDAKKMSDQDPIRSGIYDVADFVINKDTIPAIVGDSTRWTHFILQPGTTGSLISSDTVFRKAYGRSYFGYFVDSTKQQIEFRWAGKQTDSLFTLKYTIPDSSTILLRGPVKGDTLFVRLKRTNKQYRLAEKQFHWLSEYNR
jgi:hypothetical protein